MQLHGLEQNRSLMRRAIALVLFAHIAICASAAHAADRIRIAAQKTGTLAWELDVMRAEKLDTAAGLDVVVTELAAPEAGKIALKGKTVDLIVTDWLWVSRERALGGTLAFHPFASTLGAVMVRPDSGIKDVASLKGKRLAVAGGALDKSWLMLQALARAGGLDLRKDATVVYGAPPLLSQKALQGEHDATLTFWNFAASLEAKGLVRAIDIADVQRRLGASGPVAILGYAFEDAWAAANAAVLERFLTAAHKAKLALAGSDAHWTRLAARIGVSTPEELAVYRARYTEGIPRRTVEQEERDARALFSLLAKTGGADLVGPAPELSAGTFWRPPRKS